METSNPSRRREIIVVLSLSLLAAVGAFLFFTLAGGWLFIAMLGVVAALAGLGLFHWFTWGHAATRQVPARPPQPVRRHDRGR